jgi:uncharacterized membrane protein
MDKIVPTFQWIRLIFVRGRIGQILMTSISFSVCLILARFLYTGRLSFFFLVWNLFLACVPYIFSHCLAENEKWTENKFKFGLVFILWLIFIPNSFYILTDLFHLIYRYPVPFWFDLVLILSFAWNGLLMGILSVWQMEKVIQPFLPGKKKIYFLYPIMVLNAFGVYIGRFLRFNSWDVLTNPFQLAEGILDIVLHPVEYRSAWGMTFCFSIFMTLIHLTLKTISKPSGKNI